MQCIVIPERDAAGGTLAAFTGNSAGQNSPSILFDNSSIPRFYAGRDSYSMILDEFGTYHDVLTIDNTPHPWLDKTFPKSISFLNRVL